MDEFGLVDSNMIAYFASRNQKNMTDEKAEKILHAFQINNAIESSLMLPVDPVCTFRNCSHHYSQYSKSWLTGDGKRKRCRCKHMVWHGMKSSEK
jgi:hypothetical protein